MSRTVLVTGANRGIGLAFAKHYQSRGDQVIAVCRSPSTELQALDVKIIDGVDVGRDEGVRHLLQALGDRQLDLLIQNAGIMRRTSLGSIDAGAVREQFEINALAPLMLTQALSDNLAEGSKLAFITSRMGSIADNTSGGGYGYRMSKTALNAAGKSLALDLKPRGIAVAILLPGFVQTDMVGGMGDVTPEEAVRGLTQRIEELNVDNTGAFWHAQGETLPW